MEMKRMLNIIENSISLFGKNELAYLSLTSKNELPIRDKIAYRLHLELDKSVVAREYSPKEINSRIDLAILEDHKLKEIVELKSMYTFDSIDGFDKYKDVINKDFDKNKSLVDNTINQWEIIIATHIKQIPNQYYKEYIKYYSSIKRYMEKVDEPEYLIRTMDSKIRNEFKSELYDIDYKIVNAGHVFGVDVEVCFWIILKK